MHGNYQSIFERDDLTLRDIENLVNIAALESRESFWSFRQFMNPKMIPGWWQMEVAVELQRFWEDFIAGKRPKVLLQSPPQHGKSTAVIDFLAWAIGQSFLIGREDLKIIFASFSDRLGIRANLRLQRILNNPNYWKSFGRLLGGSFQRQNSDIIQFIQRPNATDHGYFRNTTIAGQVTGEGLDLGIIDDPIKGRAEASSQVTRDKTWHWLTDDFMTRFSDQAGMLMIMTRWHVDDPAGRLIEQYPGVKVLRYTALAERDERHFDLKLKRFTRHKGEPLFAELKSVEFLEAQRQTMTLAGWESVYQQSPIIVGGDMFPVHRVELLREPPALGNVMTAVRYWDKAGTAEGGAYSAGVLMARMKDGTFTVVDVRRGQWSALDRERMIKQTAEIDRQKYRVVKIFVEQEPGSGGKESAESTIRNLAGYSIEADKVTGAKEVRADPFAAQWQAGNVKLVSADWNRNYLDEHEHFPVGKYKDQVDASSGAFNKLASKYRYECDMSWVG